MSNEYFGVPQQKPNDELTHYGVKYKSGRYPYGSGEVPYQHDPGFHIGDGRVGSVNPEPLTPQKKPKVISVSQAVKEHSTIREYVNDLRREGFTDTEIAHSLRMETRAMKATITAEVQMEYYKNVREAQRLYSELGNKSEVARKMNVSEGSVRNYLKDNSLKKSEELVGTIDKLKEVLKDNLSVDIGKGIEHRMGVRESILKGAIGLLEKEGYQKVNVRFRHPGTGNVMNRLVLAKPETPFNEITHNPDKAYLFNDTYSEDGGKTWSRIEYPTGVSFNRVMVRYPDQGGTLKDGLIEIRPGLKDLDMGKNQYAQVRIAVKDLPDEFYKEGETRKTDPMKYMKGMAIYNPNLPEGVDIVYNSSKTNKAKVFKSFEKISKGPNAGEIDKTNPFGSLIKNDEYDENGLLKREVGQRHYLDDNGEKQLSPINIVREQGDWYQWSRRLSSQFLSKQDPKLIKQQLKLAHDKKLREFNEIAALTNPEVKQRLLSSFADECDSMAVHLKAAALPGGSVHVLLPMPGLKDNEVYAPNYRNGDIVSLVRHPHEGTFQIPTLVVNNNNREARKLLGDHSTDAIFVNHNVAEQLSGADFDGDTVLVLPNPDRKVIASRPILDGLRDFDDKALYTKPDGVKKTGLPKDHAGHEGEYDGFHEQREMGKASNLITDMTLRGALDSEVERAVRYSMTVIDAEKHNLDWKQCALDNDIAGLQEKYQFKKGGGASTLISKAKKELSVPARKSGYKIDPETGKKIFIETGEEALKKIKHVDPETGEITYEYKPTGKLKMQKSTYMAEVDDAYELSSGHIKESIYADYANSMKDMGNKARKMLLETENSKTNQEAKKIYAKEAEELDNILKNIIENKPLERKALALAAAITKARKKENPDWDEDDEKKHRAMALDEARSRMHYKRYKFIPTARQWEAMQSGAISHQRMKDLLLYADLDAVKKLATPKNYTTKLSTAEIALARSMNARYTQAEIAEHLGVSVATINKLLNS